MNRRYLVQITEHRVFEVEVLAESDEDAVDKANAQRETLIGEPTDTYWTEEILEEDL